MGADYEGAIADVAGPPAAWAGARLTIDLGALVANWRHLAALVRPAEAAAVVKADGYGLGLETVGRALAEAGCGTFFVAHLAEAVRLRAALPGAPIFVLNGLPPGTEAVFAAHGLRPVLGSLEEFAAWTAFNGAEPEPQPAALHVDTGMNRLGLRPAQALQLAPADLAGAGIGLLMSHFVSAEIADDPLNARQLATFERIRQRFPGVPASLANSSGIFLGREAHLDLVRPGYALYGGNPTPGRPNPMRPVVRLEARVVQVRTVPDGETVGYDAQWTARGTRRIAVVGVGYADGFLRAGSSTDLAPGASAWAAGRLCPLAGRISMDLTAIDISELPDQTIERGDTVEVIGGPIGIDEAGASAGTSGYEILTSLGRRYHRAYVRQSDR